MARPYFRWFTRSRTAVLAELDGPPATSGVPGYNQSVRSRLGRGLIALFVAPWLFCAPAMPDEHIHEADADHPQSIAHHHFQPHELGPHDHDAAEFDHDDDHVVWIGNTGLVPPIYHAHVTWA